MESVSFAFSIISQHWDGADNWNPSLWNTGICFKSMTLMLMTWWCKEPGHQQPCYWLSFHGIFWIQCHKDWPICLFHISETNDTISQSNTLEMYGAPTIEDSKSISTYDPRSLEDFRDNYGIYGVSGFINSLARGRCGSNIKKNIAWLEGIVTSGRQQRNAISHFLSPCWPRYMLLYGVTRRPMS